MRLKNSVGHTWNREDGAIHWSDDVVNRQMAALNSGRLKWSLGKRLWQSGSRLSGRREPNTVERLDHRLVSQSYRETCSVEMTRRWDGEMAGLQYRGMVGR